MRQTRLSAASRRQVVVAAFAAAAVLAQPAVAGAQPAGEAIPPDWASTYHLGAGDKLHVTVFNEPNLSGDFSISDAGDISLPLVGRLPVAGVTVHQLEDRLRQELGRSLQKPEVAVEILTYRPFYILGEVQRPGQYPFAAGMTLMGAVATAGGFTYRANARALMVRRSGGKTEVPQRANSDALVLPGDTIRVRERWF